MATKNTFWSKSARKWVDRDAGSNAPNSAANFQMQLAGGFGCNSLYFENKALILHITPFVLSNEKWKINLLETNPFIGH